MKPRIKICGLREPDMAQKAVELGAHMIGIICHPSSKRYVKPELAKEIAKAVTQAGAIPALVLVNQNADEIQSLCDDAGVNTVQLHGENARAAEMLLPDNLRRIYVLGVDEKGVVQQDARVANLKPLRDLLLYDNLQAGSGTSFNWDQFKPAYDLPFLFSGGLTSDNVSKAVKLFKPYGLDVSSCFESEPGKK